MKLIYPLVLTLLLAMVGSAAIAATCDDVIYRIWQNGESTFYDFGAEIPLEIGKEAHFYLHYRSKSPSPYSTSAEIGYPRPFGLRGPSPQAIGEVLKLKAQSDKDTQDGRMILEGTKFGSTSLGYRMSALRHPGNFDQVPATCRTGQVIFKVGGDVDVDDDDDREEPAPPTYDAANVLLANLYQGLLRRETAEGLPVEHLEIVRQRGHAGLVDLAADMMRSAEFRSNAFDRTISNHSDLTTRSKPRDVLEALLADIYLTLYGSGSSIDERVHERRFEDLDICLSTFSSREAACQRLGRSLVEDRSFTRHHSEDLERVRGALRGRGVGRDLKGQRPIG